MAQPLLANTAESGYNYLPGIGTVWGINGGVAQNILTTGNSTSVGNVANRPEIIPFSCPGTILANGAIGTQQLSNSAVGILTANISSAQLLAGNAVTVGSPPGAGLTIQVNGPVEYSFVAGTTPYTGAATSVIQYATGNIAATGTIANTAVVSTANYNGSVVPVATANVTANDTLQWKPSAAYANSGNGFLLLNIPYRIAPAN